MRIAMVASECEPFAKTGGLADVVDALSRALGQLGHEVDVYLPFYRGIAAPDPAERLHLIVPIGNERVPVTLWSATGRGYRLRLVYQPESFDRPSYYMADGHDYPDNGFRFNVLGRAALEAIRAERRPVDVIHAHDWEGVPAILSLRTKYADDQHLGGTATMLTCHNLAYHGWVRREDVAPQLDLPADIGYAEGVDLLREGIFAAHLVNTVSPTFARESLQPGGGSGVEDALSMRGDEYFGIINGLDNELWNPATDGDLAARYTAADLAGKAVCKQALCQELGLDPGGPLFAMIGRLDPQKGFDLLADAAPALLAAGARIAVLGTGDHGLVGGLQALAAQHPARLAVEARFDRVLARRMYAGADAFVMPSRFEPCGQGQMIAMRYGTVPIVRETGGLVDTVIDADHDSANGTGFRFGAADPGALFDACARAARAMADGARWSEIQQRAMATDFSWSGPARDYVAAYRRAIELTR